MPCSSFRYPKTFFIPASSCAHRRSCGEACDGTALNCTCDLLIPLLGLESRGPPPPLMRMSHCSAAPRMPSRLGTRYTPAPAPRPPSDPSESGTPRLRVRPSLARSRKPRRGGRPARAPRKPAEPAHRCGRVSRPRATPCCSLDPLRTSGSAGGGFLGTELRRLLAFLLGAAWLH